MSARGFDAVVVDTNVYAAVLGTDPHAIAAKYEPHLTGSSTRDLVPDGR